MLTNRQFWLAALLILVGLWLNQQVSANFLGASSQSTVSHLFGVLHWAATGGNLKEFIELAGRFGLFLMLFTPLLVLNINRQYGILVIACFLVIAAQPLLAGPGITGNNIQRLLTYCVPFVGFLFVGQVQKPAAVALFASAMMLLSLHHNYTVIDSQWVFGVIVLLVAVASVTYFFWQNYCSKRATGR